jgi:hypothetical protein
MKVRLGCLILLFSLFLIPVSTFASTWAKSYGGSNYDVPNSIQQTSDGGFIVAGGTLSFCDDCIAMWVLKLNATGNVIWQKTYGGVDIEWLGSIEETSDGGFIFAGTTYSFGVGAGDYWVLKLDANGNIPGCELIQDTSVVPVNTNVIPATTDSVPVDTAATVTSTLVEPINTTATVEEQCLYSESSTDLVYTAVTPCRIVDTRLAGDAIPPGGIRSYNVWGDVVSQGGNSSGCPSPKGEPYTAHINVTAVPLGNGNIVAYPFNSATPNASLVNYRSDAQNVANSGTVKTCFTAAKILILNQESAPHT